jgi:hypothetical protein
MLFAKFFDDALEGVNDFVAIDARFGESQL